MKRNDGKGKNRVKKLSEYFKADLYREYMINHVTPIIRKGDYYKITKAEKILDDSNFSRKKKKNFVHSSLMLVKMELMPRNNIFQTPLTENISKI